MFRNGTSIVGIAAKDNVDPGTVSSRLHKLGINIKMGQHHVRQLPLKYSDQFIRLVGEGPEQVMDFLNDRVAELSQGKQHPVFSKFALKSKDMPLAKVSDR